MDDSINLKQLKSRKDNVNSALGVLLCDGRMPNKLYMNACNDYILGKITAQELKEKVLNKDFLYE